MEPVRGVVGASPVHDGVLAVVAPSSPPMEMGRGGAGAFPDRQTRGGGMTG